MFWRFILLSCIGVVAAADAGQLKKKHLSFDLSKHSVIQDQDHAKRSIDVPIENKITFYRTTLSIGSPIQHVSVQIDTGSSDLWLMSSKNPLCREKSSTSLHSIKCDKNFMFNYAQSSTFQWNTSEPKFSISYGDSTFANGSYCTDVLHLGGSLALDSANFAVATRANSSEAVWGIGMMATEAMGRHVDREGDIYPSYCNIPQQLKDNGIIDAVAYSLWLNTLDSSSGRLLFGAVDHSKYAGQLQTIPMVSTYQGIDHPIDFSVMLHGISLFDKASNATAAVSSFALPFLLDSGTTYSMLPDQILKPLMDSIGAMFSDGLGAYILPCESLSAQSGLIFDLSGIHIEVPFSELLIPIHETADNQPQCMVGLYPALSSNFILGDTFLRSAYVVYNLEKKEISIAQALRTEEEDNIESIEQGAEIPGAVRAQGYTSTDVHASFTLQPTHLFSTLSHQSLGNHMVKNGAGSLHFSKLLWYMLYFL